MCWLKMLCFLISFEHQIYGFNYITVNPTNLQTMSGVNKIYFEVSTYILRITVLM